MINYDSLNDNDDEDYSISTFVVSWCCEGLEHIIPITEIERQQTFDILTGKIFNGANIHQSVNMMLLRARFNTQRYYEIYAIQAQGGIDADDLREMFKNDPQGAANLIRERGQVMFSDRQQNKVVIS